MDKIPGGYYIKARCIKDSWISHAAPITREVWDYLLREANHVDGKYRGFTILRGQLFRSYREIRDDLSWKVGYRICRYHESAMKRAMNALMKELMIELTSEPRGNLITILNYDFYQDPANYGRTDERTNERTNGEPMANQYRSAINKNEKNNKKERKDKKTFLSDSDEIRLANYLFKHIQKNNPQFKPPRIQSWASHIDLMLRVDKRPMEDIKAVIEWCQKNTFWKNNILGTEKLRAQYDQLFAKMRNGDGKPQESSMPSPPLFDPENRYAD